MSKVGPPLADRLAAIHKRLVKRDAYAFFEKPVDEELVRCVFSMPAPGRPSNIVGLTVGRCDLVIAFECWAFWRRSHC
jgi:hypothetical protein